MILRTLVMLLLLAAQGDVGTAADAPADAIAGKPLENFDAWTKWQRAISAGMDTARPAAIGSYPRGASPYGVLDMAGNVWEWVADWYDPEYYATSPARNPTGPETGEDKVLRGGGWDVPQTIPVTWLREQFLPPEFAGSPVTGFRCAATTPPGLRTVQWQQSLHYSRAEIAVLPNARKPRRSDVVETCLRLVLTCPGLVSGLLQTRSSY
jgi:hypothetical protein